MSAEPDERFIPLMGLVVDDGRIVIELIDKYAESGVHGEELLPLGILRKRVVAAIDAARRGFAPHEKTQESTKEEI